MSATRQRVETERTGALACAPAQHFERKQGNTYTQAIGPHVAAKNAIKKQTKATRAFCAGWLLESVAVLMAATMKWQTIIPAAPTKSIVRRPALSVSQRL